LKKTQALLPKLRLKQIVPTHKKSHYYNQTASETKTICKNKIHYAASTIKCLKNADCYILVTEWDEFKKLKPEDFTKNMKQPILIDGRRIYNPEEFSQKMKFTAIRLGH
jgi:UDPglucose 6-dehydrogenase